MPAVATVSDTAILVVVVTPPKAASMSEDPGPRPSRRLPEISTTEAEDELKALLDVTVTGAEGGPVREALTRAVAC
jgi:hypothetical protein